MSFAEYSNYDGVALAELVKKKKVKPSELVEAAIERIERHNPQLNAVVFKAYDEARAKAAAKLSGALPVCRCCLKDILGDKKGWPTRSGSRFVPTVPSAFDATLVARFEAAGLIPLGKTNVPEFGLVPLTEPKLYGPARNPWNLDHSTGGSSGGSAAAVAAGIVPIAHANDGGGSIRIPASCCGLVGLKPTRGRNPLGPMFGDIFGGLIAEHVVSRSVRDTAAALDVTAGPEIGDPYAAPPAPGSYLAATKRKPKKLRIAFATKRFSGEAFDPECKAATEAAAKLCAKLGHRVEEGMPPMSGGDISANFPPIWASGLAMVVDFVAKASGKTPAREEFEGLTWSLYQFGKTVTAAQYQGCWISLARPLAPSRGMAADLRRLDHAGARDSADEDWHDQPRGNRSDEGLGADLGLRSIHGAAKHYRPAGYQPAARLVEGGRTDRRTVCRSLRRGALAAPTCGADRKG